MAVYIRTPSSLPALGLHTRRTRFRRTCAKCSTSSASGTPRSAISRRQARPDSRLWTYCGIVLVFCGKRRKRRLVRKQNRPTRHRTTQLGRPPTVQLLEVHTQLRRQAAGGPHNTQARREQPRKEHGVEVLRSGGGRREWCW